MAQQLSTQQQPSSPVHPLELKVARRWPPDRWSDVTVIAAVSGGPDSVAMLRVLESLHDGPGRIVVAHFNHRLRTESDEDQRFAVELATERGLKAVTGVADKLTLSAGEGVEAAAREARYEFFRDVAGELGARYVVTGHTADDQAETVLHRILRGSGLRGLAGIPQARQLMEGVSLFRPLLSATRAEVVEYLGQLRQPFRLDHSNQETTFMRNRIRNELLPLLEADYQQGVRDSLVRLGRLAEEANTALRAVAQEALTRAAVIHPQRVELDAQVFRTLDPYVARLVLMETWRQSGWPERDMSYDKWQTMYARIVDRQPPSPTTFPGGVRLFREADDRWILTRAD